MLLNLQAVKQQLEHVTGREYSWSQIARETDLHRHTVERIASNRTKQIRFETLERLLEFFHSEGLAIKIDDFFEYPGAGPRALPTAPAGVVRMTSRNGSRLIDTMPTPTPEFTGRRREIEALASHLRNAGAVAHIAGIRNVAGLGRTELALAVAQRLRSRYPDACLYYTLQAGGTALSPTVVLAAILQLLAPDTVESADSATFAQRYRERLASYRGILILDHVADSAQLEPFLPPPPGWIIIVTSRTRFPVPDAYRQNLDVLPEEEAVSLLRRLLLKGGRSSAATADPGLRALATICGFNPLALRLACSFLDLYDDWSIRDYVTTVERDQLQDFTAEGEHVAAILDVHLQQLSYERPELAERWYWLSVFPASFTADAAAAIWEMKAIEARTHLEVLCRHELLTHDPETETYALPEGLREFTVEYPPIPVVEAWPALRMRHAEYYLRLGRHADALYNAGDPHMQEALARFDTIWPQLHSAWEWARRQESEKALQFLSDFAKDIASLLDMRLTPTERLPILEAALVAARHLDEKGAESVHLGTLGSVYAHLGDVQRAISCHETALTIDRELGDEAGQCADLTNLGNAYLRAGTVKRAVACYEQALAMLPDEDQSARSNILNNLGNGYAVLGDLDLTVECYEQALWINRHQDNRRGEGIALGNLGNAYYQRGEFDDAIACYEQALEIARELEDRHAEENVLGNLGNACYRLGEMERAIECYTEALSIAHDIGEKWDESKWLGSLGVVYRHLGEIQRAIEYSEQALARARELDDAETEAIEAWNLGLAYEELGQYEQALPLMEHTVQYERAIDHPDAEADAAHLEELRRNVSELIAVGPRN